MSNRNVYLVTQLIVCG